MTRGQPHASPPDPDTRRPPPAQDPPLRTAAEWAAHLRWRALATPRPSLADRAREAVGAPIDQLEDLLLGGGRATVADRFVANGLHVLNELVQRSRSPERVVDRYRAQHCAVRSLADVRALPLADIEAARPPWLAAYDVAAAVSGGLGGFFGVPGTAFAVPTLFYAALHAVGSHALHFGHDLSDPDEQRFVVDLLAASLVTRPSTRVEVLRNLEDAAAALEARNFDAVDTHRVAILEHVAEAVVLRVLLGFAVRGWPGVGLLLGAGFSRVFVGQVCEAALATYEQRWLLRRYGDAVRVLSAR
ncbi:MAG TPA: EcsC family protein [Polyangiaceae bacterium]|nr:EcsC family protein [Polyangiaceae bacterium]